MTRILLWASVLLGVASAADSSLRHDFVRKMEAAVDSKKRETALTNKLLSAATRIEPDEVTFEQPRFLEDYQDFAVNLTEYALKYIGCQNIHTYSDELAEDEDAGTVLGMDRFVIVRLCPRDECSNYNEFGCLSGFGDYLIAMEDYLQIMEESYFDQFEEYCQTCYRSYQCLKSQNEVAADDGDDANGDDANANGDDANANGDDGNNGRRMEDYNYYNAYDYMDDAVDDWGGAGDDANAADEDNEVDYCEYAYACQNWKTPCREYSYQMADMAEYFECSNVNVGNADMYLGPHCRSDGKTIGIGIYKDENCNAYNADLGDISEVTGLDLSDDYLKPYYSENCISCLASDGFVLEVDEDNQVADVCGMLYDESAKCNRYMGYDGEYNSYNQEQNEDVVCNFISNLVENNYDEYGEIYLESGWQAYIPTTRSMSKFQKWALSISVLLCFGLVLYSCHLHRVIKSHRFTWMPRPRKGYSNDPSGGSANAMGRTHSGIISGRSRSGINFEAKGGTLT
eukprot:CAMPEP_0117052564 /NCGR_PEP_ID=MMETSP0472-20121206/36332_1 /TAXON_ID=693140 ORGANISM="Tiarina fusus, Strain LIS" /NCGR_SAMPLE_ID=MMETSP0472 /ASSEMBLY_ACC=CAM_ASM_000603 /LENGTH=512 /DNA_ID=CAMNT_0004767235 /DNA_START=73 /DNA_END=1611 /DNA_ORIENTATION=+